MIKEKINVKMSARRIVASALVLLTVAALFVPVITLWTPEVSALPNNTEYVPDETYLSGSDFSDLPIGVIAKGGNYSHKLNGKQIYQLIPKNSVIKVVSESGNNFLRYERSTNSSQNDVYVDVYDTQKDIYKGDFVVEISVRLMDYPQDVGQLNLMQFINRDNGNIFQGLMNMSGDGSVRYVCWNSSNNRDTSVDTGYDMVIGEWTHLCVVMHRNETERDTMDVYINGEQYADKVPVTNQINSIHQFRICQTSGGTALAHVVDLDNVWLYKGSSPAFTVGSGAPADSVVGALDYTDPALAVGAAVKGKVTTDKFEIDAKNDIFSVHKDTWRTLLKMDQSKGAPYVDVYANGASGALVADMAIILGNDWKGQAELISPFAASGDYVSRDSFLFINPARQLTDKDGNVLAELGTGLNRIAIGFSGDRGYASVFVNGKLISTVETGCGSAYKKLDGVRFIQFGDSVDAGTAYLYYAEIYRGSLPAISLGDTKLEYRNDFDSDNDNTLAPITFVGVSGLIEGYEDDTYVVGLWESTKAGSAVRYASPIKTSALSMSFTLSAWTSSDLDVVRLGSTPILSLNGSDGRLSVNSSTGAISLFKLEAEREYQVTLVVSNGGLSLYIDGIPFVNYAPIPENTPANAEYIDFLYAKKDGPCSVYVDNLEIYTGGSPFVSGAQIPIIPNITAVNHKASITWNAISMADGYRVYRSLTADGEYTDVSGLLTKSEYVDGGVISGTKYYYRVAAVFLRSGEEFALGLNGAPTPFEDIDPAIGTKATGIPGGVKLTWNEFHSANLGYSVYRSYEENTGYEAIAENLKELEYTDTDIFPGLVTYYKVCVIIERDGQPFVFGLDQKPIEATAGNPDDPTEPPTDDPTEPPTDDPTDDPTLPPEDDGELPTPMDPVEGGVNIPEASTEKLFGTDFEKPLADIGALTVNGSGFNTADTSDTGKALILTASTFNENRFVSTELGAPTSLSILIDMSISVKSATKTVYLLAPASEDAALFHLLEVKSQGDTVTLYMGLGVGGESKAIATFKTSEWHRVTVWITATGDKAAIYLDGTCLVADAALPETDGNTLISAMSSIRFMGINSEATVTDTDTAEAVSVMMDSVTVRNANVFANAFNSAVLTPKVSVSEQENTLTWKAANGALFYTVWRADESGEFKIIATELKTTEFIDYYDKDCSYKVTYTYGNVGVSLSALASSTGISAKKTVADVIVDTVSKLIDLEKPGTLGILIVTGAAVLAIAIVYVTRTFVLKVDPAQPNRLKKDQ